MDSTEKTRAVNREYKRLLQCAEGMDNLQKVAFEKLLNEAAFLWVSLQELREQIAEEGMTEQYINGPNQYGTKTSATVTTYDKLLNTYSKIVGQISRKLPEGSGSLSAAAADIMAFINR